MAWADLARTPASLLTGAAACALLLGLSNLVPFHAQGWRSDGRSMLDLLRSSADGALHLRTHRLLALSMAGVRPRDWPTGAEPSADAAGASPLMAVNADLLRLSWAMDHDDRDESARLAQRLADTYPTLPPAFQPHVAVMLGWHAARMLRDGRVLAAWRARSDGGINDLSLLRAWLAAEQAVLDGDPGAAGPAIARARGLLETAMDRATELQIGERLEALAARASAQIADATGPVKDA